MEITCTNCSFKFKSAFFSGFANSHNVTFIGNKESCPRCGTMCNTPNGTYRFDENGKATLLDKLRDIDLSESQIENIQNVAEKARNNEITIEEFESELNSITPKLNGIIPENVRTRKAFLEFLVFLLALLITLKANSEQPNKIMKLDKTKNKTEKKANIKRMSMESDSLLIEARRRQLKHAKDFKKAK